MPDFECRRFPRRLFINMRRAGPVSANTSLTRRPVPQTQHLAGRPFTGRIAPGDPVMILTRPTAALSRPTTETRTVGIILPAIRTVYDG